MLLIGTVSLLALDELVRRRRVSRHVNAVTSYQAGRSVARASEWPIECPVVTPPTGDILAVRPLTT
jgi:hypothetical protein